MLVQKEQAEKVFNKICNHQSRFVTIETGEEFPLRFRKDAFVGHRIYITRINSGDAECYFYKYRLEIYLLPGQINLLINKELAEKANEILNSIE